MDEADDTRMLRAGFGLYERVVQVLGKEKETGESVTITARNLQIMLEEHTIKGYAVIPRDVGGYNFYTLIL
jgi:hypothetical protein